MAIKVAIVVAFIYGAYEFHIGTIRRDREIQARSAMMLAIAYLLCGG